MQKVNIISETLAAAEQLEVDLVGLESKTKQSTLKKLGNQILAGVPITVSDDTVTAQLAPTSQANSNSEYAALISGKKEIKFITEGILSNVDKIFTHGCHEIKNTYGITAKIASAPRPTSSTLDWWARGGMRFYIQGEGSISIVYSLNNVNKVGIFIDGKRLSNADSSGLISNSVSSTANALQWVTITLTGDKRRLITVDSPNVYSIVHDWGITMSKCEHVGKSVVFGDSFAGRLISSGETATSHLSLCASAMELLGYDVIDASTGGTGFVNNGGGASSNKGNYSDYIDIYKTENLNLDLYDAIWLFGSGNDFSYSMTIAKYQSVIQKALDTFPNAKIYVTSVYEAFNDSTTTTTLNPLLKSACLSFSDRVIFVPVDSVNKWDGVGVWSGTGSVAAPANNGNADVYFSNALQGAGDRHPNINGVAYGAIFYAYELLRAGIKSIY